MTAPGQSPAHYRIRIRGHLDPAWSADGPAAKRETAHEKEGAL
jgi:hypothetical protein